MLLFVYFSLVIVGSCFFDEVVMRRGIYERVFIGFMNLIEIFCVYKFKIFQVDVLFEYSKSKVMEQSQGKLLFFFLGKV